MTTFGWNDPKEHMPLGCATGLSSYHERLYSIICHMNLSTVQESTSCIQNWDVNIWTYWYSSVLYSLGRLLYSSQQQYVPIGAFLSRMEYRSLGHLSYAYKLLACLCVMIQEKCYDLTIIVYWIDLVALIMSISFNRPCFNLYLM